MNNLIISNSDTRYGKLGHIWKKYNYSNYRTYESMGSKYIIPKELIINSIDRWTGRDNHIYGNKLMDYWCPCNSFSRLLFEFTELTVQEYYDLIILRINNILNRPRCMYCHKYLDFCGRFQHGYGIFCNSSHNKIYTQMHPEFSPATHLIRINDYATYESRLKAIYNHRNSHENETYYLYIALIDQGYYLGYSFDLDNRWRYSFIDGLQFKSVEILYSGNKDLIKNLYFHIRLLGYSNILTNINEIKSLINSIDITLINNPFK